MAVPSLSRSSASKLPSRRSAPFFAARARLGDVDRRKNTLLHDGTIEIDLHVTGPLVFLKNQVIHAAMSLHKGRCENGETSTLLHIACRSEELLRAGQGRGIDTTAHGASLSFHVVVIAAGETGDAVDEDHHILFQLHETLCPFGDHFGDLDVTGCRLVECGAEDIAIEGPPEICYFLGTFVDQ